MFNLQGSEIIFILLLALVVLGPEKLPSAIRRFTQTYAELRKMGTGFQSELKSALDEPMREMKETAGLIRDQADPGKIAAEADQQSTPDTEGTAQRAFEADRAVQGPPVGSDAAPDASPIGADAPDDGVDEWADPVDGDDEPDDEGQVQESA